jgi:acyl-CoA hydrolase
MTQLVLPQDTNAMGTAFGGTVMGWIDICAAISAQRHCRAQVVTVAVDQLHFVEPIRLGMVVVLKAQVNAAFQSSMEVGVRVASENPRTGERRHALSAYLTFVALSPDGGRVVVPRAVAVTEEEKQRARDAEARRAQRLQWRKEREGRRGALSAGG